MSTERRKWGNYKNTLTFSLYPSPFLYLEDELSIALSMLGSAPAILSPSAPPVPREGMFWPVYVQVVSNQPY